MLPPTSPRVNEAKYITKFEGSPRSYDTRKHTFHKSNSTVVTRKPAIIFNRKREIVKLGKHLSDFITKVESTATNFQNERETADNQLVGLDNDIELIQKKYDHIKKLSSLGFSVYDSNLNLRSQLK